MRFEELLIDRGLVTRDRLAEARASVHRELRLDEALVDLGFVSEQEVVEALGAAMGLPVVSLPETEIDASVLQLVPSEFVYERQLLPIGSEDGVLRVATRNPFDVYTLDELHARTGLDVDPVLATHGEITNAIKEHFGLGGQTVGKLLGDAGDTDLSEDLDKDDDELAEEASVVKLVNEILAEAIERRASDIHIEPRENGLRLRYRIDGVLQVQPVPPAIRRFGRAIVSRLKIMAKLNIAEKRLPQDGRIELRQLGRPIDLRVSIIPMIAGEGVVLRVLDKGSMRFDLTGVGMQGDHLDLWSRLIELPHGILLVTGPTGSGKTTTLYSALNSIARDEVKVITVEDPVEYHFDRIQQIQVQPKIGLSFAAGLRSILRHDPDVVLVGEIRDLETAEVATQAALTGHLVFSTLHTNDAAGAITRLTDMGVEPFLVSSTVEGILAQRLVRRICTACKTPHEPQPGELPPDFPHDLMQGNPLYKGEGCRECNHTGYRGRQGIFELMPMTDTIREMCVERRSSAAIKREAMQEGLVTLRRDGWRAVSRGVTTVEEVMRVTKSDDAIRQETMA